MARAALKWKYETVSQKTGIKVRTLKRLETIGAERTAAETVAKLRKVYENAGIQFVDEGVVLRRTP